MNTNIVVDEYCRFRKSQLAFVNLREAFETLQDTFSNLSPTEEFARLGYWMNLVIEMCGGESKAQEVDTFILIKYFNESKEKVESIKADDEWIQYFKYSPDALSSAMWNRWSISELAHLHFMIESMLSEQGMMVVSRRESFIDELRHSKYFRYMRDAASIQREAERLYERLRAVRPLMTADVPEKDVESAQKLFNKVLNKIEDECNKDLAFIRGEIGSEETDKMSSEMQQFIGSLCNEKYCSKDEV